MKEPSRLFALMNFDGTTFNTYKPSPSGIGVHEAYDLAVEKTFGLDALALYQEELGGLQGREPGELVDEIRKKAAEVGLELPEFPSRKDEVQSLVTAKVSAMLSDISPEWPPPYPGVIDFFKAVETGEIPITVGIASSGHTAFIQKVFRAQNLTPPKIIVSADQINILDQPMRPKFKPFTYQVASVHYQLLCQTHGKDAILDDNEEGRFLGRNKIKPNLMFIGDHPTKDMGLAARSRIAAGFVPFVYPEYIPDESKGQKFLEDFAAFHHFISRNIAQIAKGQTWTEILFGIPDSKFFPPVPEDKRPYQQWLKNPNHPDYQFLF